MAAENKTGEPSFSPATAEGRAEYSNSASQLNSPVLLTGAAANQSYATGSPQTPILGATSVRILPPVHATRHPLAACVASSVNPAASFAAYTRRVTPLFPGSQQGKGSVVINPVQRQPNIVTGTVPAVRQPARPTAVLDLGNNGILNAVLGRLPNVGTMVVHNLDPGSLIQKNIVAMIDGRTAAVTTATAVPIVNFQPVLTLSYQGTLQPASHTSSPITRHVSQHSLPPFIVSQIGSREPLVACSVTAQQHVAFSQSSVGVTNTCSQQPSLLNPSLLNPAVVRPTVMVRTIANTSGHTQLSLSVSPAVGSRFPSINSTEFIPRIKRPHTASSLPGAVVRYHATTSVHAVQQSPTSQSSANESFPAQSQLVAAVPSFVSGNAVSGSSIDTISPSSTVGPSESLTTIIPSSVMLPFEIPQSAVSAKSAAIYMATLSTHSPLVAGSSPIAVNKTDDHASAAQLATSLIQVPTSAHIMCNSNIAPSSVFSTYQTFASNAPPSVSALTVPGISVPTETLHQGHASCSSKPKKVTAKRPPQRRKASTAYSVSGQSTNVNQATMLQLGFQSSAVGMPIVSPTKSLAPVTIDPLPYAAATCASTSALVAGVKRKCAPGQKYTLLLENGCKYMSAYFDGEGFQAKKRTISSVQSGSCCCYCYLLI